MSLKNVVVVGGSGNLGPSIIKELVAGGLNVTVTTRDTSKANFDPAVKVVSSDYSNESLTSIFKGQDAIISTIAGTQVDKQRDLIDAAIEAGVKRFFPSEFGGDTTNPDATKLLPFFKGKQDIAAYLKSKESTGLTWTGIVRGPFFDWGFNVGFIEFDAKAQKVAIWDDGNTKFESSTLSTIGKALANILNSAELVEATKNQYVKFNSFHTSQNEILAIVEEITGKKWEVSHKYSKEEIPKNQEALQAGNEYAVYELLKAAIYGKDVIPPSDVGGNWNQKLGLPKEDLKAELKRLLNA